MFSKTVDLSGTVFQNHTVFKEQEVTNIDELLIKVRRPLATHDIVFDPVIVQCMIT